MSNIEKTALSSLLDDLPVALNAALGAGIGGYGLNRYNKLLQQGSSELASHVKNLDELTKLKSKIKAPIKTKDIHDYEDAMSKFRAGTLAREPAETVNIRRYADDLKRYQDIQSKMLEAPTSLAANVARNSSPMSNAVISTLLPSLAAGAIGGQEAMLASALAPRLMSSSPLGTQMLSAAAAGQVGDVAMSHLSPGIQQAIGSSSGALKNLSDNLFSGYTDNPQTIANSLATGKNKLLTYLNPTRAFDEVSDIPRYLAAGMGLKYLNRRTAPAVTDMAGAAATDKAMEIAQYIPGLELYSKLSPKLEKTLSKAKSYLDKKRYVRREMKEIDKLLATGAEKNSSYRNFSKQAISMGFMKNIGQKAKNLFSFSGKTLAPVGAPLPAPAAFNPQAMSKLKAPAGAGGLGLSDEAATQVGNAMAVRTDDELIKRMTTYGHNPYAYMVAGGVGAGALGAYSGDGATDSALKGVGYGVLGALAGRGGAAASQAIKRMGMRGAAASNKALTGRTDYIQNMYQKQLANNTDFAGRETHNVIKGLTGDAQNVADTATRNLKTTQDNLTAAQRAEGSFGAAVTNHTNTLTSLNQDLITKQQALTAAENALKSAPRKKALQNAVAAAQAEVNNINTQISSANSSLSLATGELNKAKGLVDTYQGQINSHKGNLDSAQNLLKQYSSGSANLATVRSGGVNFAKNTGYIDDSGNFVAGIGKDKGQYEISQNIAHNLNAYNPQELQTTINSSFNASNKEALATLMSRAGAGDEAASKAMNMAGAHMSEMANIQRQQYSNIAGSVSDTLNRTLPGMKLNPQQLASHPNFSQYVQLSQKNPDGASQMLNNIVADMNVGFRGGSQATIQSATQAATQSAAVGVDNMNALLKGKADELTKHLNESSTLAINSSIGDNISKSNTALQMLRSSNPAVADEITAKLNTAVSELSKSGNRAGANKLLSEVNEHLTNGMTDDALKLLAGQSGKANPYTETVAKQTISNLGMSSREEFGRTLESLKGRLDDRSIDILTNMSKASDKARAAAISGDVTALYASSVDDLERISAGLDPELARKSMDTLVKSSIKNASSYFGGAAVPPEFAQKLSNLAQLSRSNPKEYNQLMKSLSQARDPQSRAVFAAANDVVSNHTKKLANSIIKNKELQKIRTGESLKFDYSAGKSGLNQSDILGDAANMTQAPVQSNLAAPLASTQSAAAQYTNPVNTNYYGIAKKGLIGAGIAGAGYGGYSMLSAPTNPVYNSKPSK